MNPPSRGLTALVALVAIPACGDDNAGPVPAAPEGYPFAYAADACGPTDGPATRLYLSADSTTGVPTDAPRLEVVIYRRAADLQGRSFSWRASSPDAWAGRCASDGSCLEASSAAVKFRDNPADTVLTGTVRLRFQDGTTASGGFEAAWRRTGLLCG